MKPGDLISLFPNPKCDGHITGMILEVLPNGSVMYPEMIAKILWYLTLEFFEDLKVHFEVISEPH